MIMKFVLPIRHFRLESEFSKAEYAKVYQTVTILGNSHMGYTVC